MRFRIMVEVDVSFDLEDDEGELLEEGVVDSDVAGQAIVDAINSDFVGDEIVDLISDRTGWAVLGMSMTVPNAECIDG